MVGAHVELEVSREVAAPSERVWAVLADLDAAPQVLSGVDAVERLDGGAGLDVGTRWRETRTMMGRQATEEMEVVSVEPGRSYTVRSTSGRTTYESVLAVEPLAADRSRLTMIFGAASEGWLARVLSATLGRLFAGATRRMLQQDLDDIAAAAQASR